MSDLQNLGAIDEKREDRPDDLDFDETLEWKERWERIKALIKLMYVVTCYAVAFATLVKLGFWLIRIPKFHELVVPTDIITWLDEKWINSILWDSVTTGMFINIALLTGFYLQHSLMTQRVLEGTSYWMFFHYIHKMDRPMYIIATAAVLQTIMKFWNTVPIVVFEWPWIREYYGYIHVSAWISLYGTSLMLDLPDMVGFNQVVISTPNITTKSPDLQMMYKTQRHMGLIPFMLVLWVHPIMTLDRLVLAILTGIYTYVSWRSPSCYEYALKMKKMKSRRVQ